MLRLINGLFIHILAFVVFTRGFQAFAQTSPVTWIFPLQDGLIVNSIDAVQFQWESTFDTAWVCMWCQVNDTIGNHVVLASSTQVQPSGSYSYNFTTDAPEEQSFPIQCHAQIASVSNGYQGVDDPVGVTFESLNNVSPKTFSLNVVTTTADPPTLTQTLVSTPSLSSSASSLTAVPTSSPSSHTVISSSSTHFFVSETPSSTSTSLSMMFSSTSSLSPTATNGPPNNPSGWISSGAKAGIISTAVVIFLVILVLGLWAILRQRRKKRESARPLVSLPTPEKGGLESFGNPRYGRYELEDEALRRHELEASRDMPEMEGDSSTRELEGDKPNGQPRINEVEA